MGEIVDLSVRRAEAQRVKAVLDPPRITAEQYLRAFDVLHRETKDDGPRERGEAAWTPSACHLVLHEIFQAAGVEIEESR